MLVKLNLTSESRLQEMKMGGVSRSANVKSLKS